ncbi:MAG: GNAT family N-acetyltransferase [Clostridia bacterium]
MEYSIRKIKDSDREILNQICIETAVYSHIKNPSGNYARAIALMFADYYSVCEKENSFVAVDENDTPKGYIMCAPNFDDYKRKFMAQFSKPLAKLGVIYLLSQKSSFRKNKKFASEYPSHLHINLLPEMQNQGVGSALIDTLFEHLQAQNIKGVMLGCYAQNYGAIKFYSRNGFVELGRSGNEVFMGKKF